MKFSESWLREWVNPPLSTEQLVAQLTMAGLEVDAVEPVVEDTITGVVVGEILSVEPHPNADRLQICQVAGHADGVQQVVCGAANARPGIKVPFATVGARLPADLKIKRAKLRDIESCGMLCGQTELKLGEDDSGLWELPADAPVGEDLCAYLQLHDRCIDVDLTPNRSDCLSLRGLAREVGVLNRLHPNPPVLTPAPVTLDDRLTVVLEAPSACPVYVGRVIRNLNLSQPSPQWLVEKLRRSGLRSIDAVVDVTNYVLLELGQPMHAFDLHKLTGNVCVRMAREGESLQLLDGQEITLNDETLVIADDSGPQAMAGIMGGAGSAVSADTRDVFLESAFFAPMALAGRARSYGLHTDSSHRFERGVDHQLQLTAIERATQLLLEIAGGNAGPASVHEDAAHKPVPVTVVLNRKKLDNLLGAVLEAEQVEDILTRLGLELLHKDPQGWQFRVPSYRFDISIEADLVEEVARVYGYDNLPTTTHAFNPELQRNSETLNSLEQLKDHLISRGYQEAITYSFVDPVLQQTIFAEARAVELLNPISADMSAMRVSLLPGLLQALKSNLNRQQARVKFFETGLRFLSPQGTAEQLRQEKSIAAVLYGNALQTSWSAASQPADFYDLKGDIESLLALTRAAEEYTFLPLTDCSWMHPGQAASINHQGTQIGQLGVLHPTIAKKLGFTQAVFVFECALQPLLQASLPRFTPVSRFPAVTRDLAVVVDDRVSYEELLRSIRAAAGEELQQLDLFDVYRGQGIAPSQKSMAFNLVFQNAARTLKEEEVNSCLSQVVLRLQQDYNAQLR